MAREATIKEYISDRFSVLSQSRLNKSECQSAEYEERKEAKAKFFSPNAKTTLGFGAQNASTRIGAKGPGRTQKPKFADVFRQRYSKPEVVVQRLLTEDNIQLSDVLSLKN